MPKTNRPRKDCHTIINYIPRQIRCIECYKKLTKWTKPNEEIQFIKEDE